MEEKELYPVGFPVLMSKYADPDYRANMSISTKMKMVDLIPTGFVLNFMEAFSNNENGTASESEWLKYEFEYYIKEYRRKLKALGFVQEVIDKQYGVRLWITGDSQGSDSIQNNFTENAISAMIKSSIQNLGVGQLHQMLRSAGMGNLVHGFTNNSTKGAKMLTNLMTEGRHISLPKIWEDSSYDTNYQFTVHLSSPYGSFKAIKRFIADPLIRLSCLVSSSSSDGITYGLPPYLFTRAYGLTYMNLAIPQNLQITRGPEDRINKYKQPLDIIATLTVTSAIPGFAALVGDGTDDSGQTNYGLKEDIRIQDMLTNPGDWDTFSHDIGSDGDFMNLLKQTKSGPAVNTVGGILKSLMPAPAYLSNSMSQSFADQNQAVSDGATYAQAFLDIIRNASGRDYDVAGTAASASASASASAPSLIGDNFRKNIDDVGLGDVMHPYLDRIT
jgi:hypothetical protein